MWWHAGRHVPSAPVHREMSLGSHGNDREVDRAQHLFCHRADEQLAELAPAPGSEQHAVRLELTDRGCNLMGRVALAHQRIAANAATGCMFAPGPQHLFRDLQSAACVVVRHSGGIGAEGRGGGKRMQKNQPRPGFTCLFQGKRHEMVQIAQVGGDEDRGWMRPAAGLGIPHGIHLTPERRVTDKRVRDVPERTAESDLDHTSDESLAVKSTPCHHEFSGCGSCLHTY